MGVDLRDLEQIIETYEFLKRNGFLVYLKDKELKGKVDKKNPDIDAVVANNKDELKKFLDIKTMRQRL